MQDHYSLLEVNIMNKKYVSETEGRKLICEAGRRMYACGLTAANDGNISLLTSPGEILCTPSGISKGFMSEDDMILVDFNGSKIKGSGTPSSEIKMHIKVYEHNPGASAVIHAHPVSATALASAGISLSEPFLTESVVVTGKIPLAPYAAAGTDDTAESIEPFCRDYNGVLLANHGAVVWADNIEKALYRMESLEHISKIYINAKFVIGNINILGPEDVRRLEERYGVDSGFFKQNGENYE